MDAACLLIPASVNLAGGGWTALAVSKHWVSCVKMVNLASYTLSISALQSIYLHWPFQLETFNVKSLFIDSFFHIFRLLPCCVMKASGAIVQYVYLLLLFTVPVLQFQFFLLWSALGPQQIEKPHIVLFI